MHESSCALQVAKGSKFTSWNFLCLFPDLNCKFSRMPFRFLLFFHYFSTVKICFPCCMGVKFHIIIALLLQRCEKHICICNTPSEIMQFLCEFCFPYYMRSIFCLRKHATKMWTETVLSKYSIKPMIFAIFETQESSCALQVAEGSKFTSKNFLCLFPDLNCKFPQCS